VGSNGLLQSVASNTARFDHNPATGESLGLLVEEARTNSYTWSEDLSNVAWSKSEVTVTNDATTAPNGTTTADQLTPSTTNAGHTLSRLGIIGAAGTFTDSVYVKASGYNFFVSTADSGGSVTYDLSNGTINSAVVATGSIVAIGNGWYRCSTTRTTTAAASIQYQIRATAGSFSFVGNGTSGIYLWGAQLEAGAFPTSYIPTTTATVIRAADVAQITGSNFSSWYNQTAGSVFVSSLLLANVNTYEASFTDNTNNNHHALRYLSTQHQLISTAGGTANSNIFSDGGGSQLSARTVYAYGSNAYSISSNGLLGSFSSTTGGIPSTVDRLNIGYSQVSGATGNLTIRRLTYWPTRLSNATLQTLTQ
jgi:hypothetical protein